MKKILFYYHHFGGLGHGTRILSLCKAIKEANPDYKLLVINSGKPQPELGIRKYARVINLPHFEAKEGLFSGLKSDEGVEATFKKRKRILDKLAKIFNSGVAVFEHFPFGRGSLDKEITPFILELKNRKCKIYSLVRDTIEQEVDIERLEEKLELFRGVIVSSEKNEGLITNFRQLGKLKEKIFFAGRFSPKRKDELISKDKIRKQLNCKNKKLIVISIGGGIDGFEILNKLIEIKDDLDKKISSLFLITTGPSIGKNKFEKLKNRAKTKKDILITKFNPAYLDYVNSADLSISMGGYNSINNALLTGTPTIIFPRYSDKEQLIRSKTFCEFFEVLDYRKTPNDELIRKIVNTINKKNKVRYDGKINGGDIAARFLDHTLNLNCIKIRLTTACNLNCDMCSWKKVRDHNFSFDQVKRLISQAGLLGTDIVNFSGGEPTLYPGLAALLKRCKSLGLITSLSTNGNVSHSKLLSFIKFLDNVDISLDSFDEETNDGIRGVKGAFKKTMGTIKTLSENKISTHINVTVRPDNLNSIHKIVPLLSNYIGSISFSLVDSTINQLDYLVFKKEELEQFYFGELIKILRECILKKLRLRITPFFKNLEQMEPEDILSEMLFNKDNYINNLGSIFDLDGGECNLARCSLRINSNGNIAPCCFLDDAHLIFGNLHERDLSSIITSHKYYNFIKNAKLGKGNCKSCRLGYKIYTDYFN